VTPFHESILAVAKELSTRNPDAPGATCLASANTGHLVLLHAQVQSLTLLVVELALELEAANRRITQELADHDARIDDAEWGVQHVERDVEDLRCAVTL
jgi:hypothetical protein